MMSAFRILTVIVMISFSLALLATHAAASEPDYSCEDGHGNFLCYADYLSGTVMHSPGSTTEYDDRGGSFCQRCTISGDFPSAALIQCQHNTTIELKNAAISLQSA